jgi:hypothetical protein
MQMRRHSRQGRQAGLIEISQSHHQIEKKKLNVKRRAKRQRRNIDSHFGHYMNRLRCQFGRRNGRTHDLHGFWCHSFCQAFCKKLEAIPPTGQEKNRRMSLGHLHIALFHQPIQSTAAH